MTEPIEFAKERKSLAAQALDVFETVVDTIDRRYGLAFGDLPREQRLQIFKDVTEEVIDVIRKVG